MRGTGEDLDLANPEGIPEGVNLTPLPAAPRENWGDGDWRRERLRRLEIVICQRMVAHFELADAFLQIETDKLWVDSGYPSVRAYFEHTFGKTWATGRRWLAQARERQALEREALEGPRANRERAGQGRRAARGPSPASSRETAGQGIRGNGPGPTQREALKAQAARGRGESPPPPPTEAEKAAAASAQAVARQALAKASEPRPEPATPAVCRDDPLVLAYRRFRDAIKAKSARQVAEALDRQGGGDILSREVKGLVLAVESERVQLGSARIGGGTGGR